MGRRRRWTDMEIGILIKYEHDLKKAAEILGRSHGAVRFKISEIRKKLGLRKNDKAKCLAFPEPDLSLRREVVERLLPRAVEVAELLLNDWKERYTNRKGVTDREQRYLNRTLQVVFDFIEKCWTGKEHLEIYKEEKEHADQSEES